MTLKEKRTECGHPTSRRHSLQRALQSSPSAFSRTRSHHPGHERRDTGGPPSGLCGHRPSGAGVCGVVQALLTWPPAGRAQAGKQGRPRKAAGLLLSCPFSLSGSITTGRTRPRREICSSAGKGLATTAVTAQLLPALIPQAPEGPTICSLFTGCRTSWPVHYLYRCLDICMARGLDAPSLRP